MARIRTIKPEFWQNKSLAQCSPRARLLAIALLQLCDKNGVFLYIPMQIHAHVFPWEEEVNISVLLGELEDIEYVKFYCVQGKEYGFIPGFSKHQRVTGKEAQADNAYPTPDQTDQENMRGKISGNHLGVSPRNTQMPREKKGGEKEQQGTVIGVTDRGDAITPEKEAQADNAYPTPDQKDQTEQEVRSGEAMGKHPGVSPGSIRVPRKGKRKGKGKEEQRIKRSAAGRDDTATQCDRDTSTFEQAWGEYPKRQGDNPKRRAFRAWNARLRQGSTPQEMLCGVLRYARWCEVTHKTGTELVKQAATFFGPDQAFLEQWEPPEEVDDENTQRVRKLSPAEQVREDARQLVVAGRFKFN